MDSIAQKLDAKLHLWKPEVSEAVRALVAEIIDFADAGALDLIRSPMAEQQMVDLLDEPASGEAIHCGKLDDLRAKVQVGIEQADQGDFVEFTAEDVKAEGRKWLATQEVTR